MAFLVLLDGIFGLSGQPLTPIVWLNMVI
ncbi:uncharacterized protein METZ01_LOCUS279551 [marine metagenome]|uniref:Uncharacterized protein n=1 Tax=marine metagenome TaxID=408172 RepID=A0A382KV83_9ZZZZ